MKKEEICDICKTEEEASQQAECFLNRNCKYAQDEETVKKWVPLRKTIKAPDEPQ